jgi:hypothetical protein
MNKIKWVILAAFLALGVHAATVGNAPVNPAAPQTPVQQQVQTPKVYQSANPLDMLARPGFYLNKNVQIKAKFDKFSTLGLDYKPAMRSSDTYISFLIQRPDVTDHNIPLSELKIFMKRTEAEKYIDLSSGDEITFKGRVFSTALGDVWMDAEEFTVLNQKTKK